MSQKHWYTKNTLQAFWKRMFHVLKFEWWVLFHPCPLHAEISPDSLNHLDVLDSRWWNPLYSFHLRFVKHSLTVGGFGCMSFHKVLNLFPHIVLGLEEPSEDGTMILIQEAVTCYKCTSLPVESFIELNVEQARNDHILLHYYCCVSTVKSVLLQWLNLFMSRTVFQKELQSISKWATTHQWYVGCTHTEELRQSPHMQI